MSEAKRPGRDPREFEKSLRNAHKEFAEKAGSEFTMALRNRAIFGMGRLRITEDGKLENIPVDESAIEVKKETPAGQRSAEVPS